MKKENMPEEQVTEQTAPKEEKQETFQSRIPTKKRTALLRYMAVLFVAAFLLVLLSFVTQLRSSNRVSASALARAEQLQEDNRELIKKASEATRYITVAREEGEQNLAKAQTAYDALMVVLYTEPEEGDVAYATAEQTVMDLKEYLSEEAQARFDEHMAQYEENEKERD